jgi:hypothetical protein
MGLVRMWVRGGLCVKGLRVGMGVLREKFRTIRKLNWRWSMLMRHNLAMGRRFSHCMGRLGRIGRIFLVKSKKWPRGEIMWGSRVGGWKKLCGIWKLTANFLVGLRSWIIRGRLASGARLIGNSNRRLWGITIRGPRTIWAIARLGLRIGMGRPSLREIFIVLSAWSTEIVMRRQI